MFADWILGESLATWALLVEILLAGGIVVLAGSRLTVYADKLADERQLGGALVGMLLLATVTSLPEVVAASTSVAIGSADMAFGALFGSCSFNITLIVMFNAVLRGGSVLKSAGRTHSLSSSLGIFLITLALIGIMLSHKYQNSPALAQSFEIGIAALIAFTYLYGVRLTAKLENRDLPVPEATAAIPRTPFLIPAIVILSLILVAASWWLAQTGDVLANHPISLIGKPLGATFVGVCFLAIASSLPEIVTGLAAIRLGNLDMALGNIFGSNMFNIFVVAIIKVVSLCSGDSLLMVGDDFNPSQNVIAGLLPILMTAIVVASLTYQTQRRSRRFGFGPDSILIGFFYIAGMIFLLS